MEARVHIRGTDESVVRRVKSIKEQLGGDFELTFELEVTETAEEMMTRAALALAEVDRVPEGWSVWDESKTEDPRHPKGQPWGIRCGSVVVGYADSRRSAVVIAQEQAANRADEERD